MRSCRAARAAFFLALVALAAPPRGALAQGSDCLPQPALACVAAGAAAAVERAWADRASRIIVTTGQLAAFAAVQAKLGDTAGVARMVALVREGEARAGDSLPLAVFLIRFHPGEDGRAMMRRLVAKADADRERHLAQGAMPSFAMTEPVAALAEAGMAAEAAALIARHRAAFDPRAAAMDPLMRIDYHRGLMTAYGAVGNAAERAAAAARAAAEAQALEGAAGRKLQVRMELARAMLKAGAVAEARATLADVRRSGDVGDYAILAFEIAAAAGDAQARAAEIAALRQRRARVIGEPGDWHSGETRHQLEALLRAGERDEAKSILAEAKAAAATLQPEERRREAQFPLGTLAAVLGDEAEVDAIAKRLAEGRDPRDSEAAHAERLRFLVVEFCRAHAQFGHAAAALRCLARVGEEGRFLAHAARARIELAVAMAKAVR